MDLYREQNARNVRTCPLALRLAGALAVLSIFATPTSAAESSAHIDEYFGTCDASAAVAVDSSHFLMANDEDSVLRLYLVEKFDAPEQVFDMSSFLQLEARKPETDIEAATRVGDRVYWISSHGRSAVGHYRPNRERFFATTIRTNNGAISVEPEGKPYSRLLEDLLEAPGLKAYKLRAASKRAPKDPGGLNIEGLCGAPDGHLLIGFRNPLPHGRALIVPLLNPLRTVLGDRAELGDPQELDLGGLGIRDLALVGGKYLIVAGPTGLEPHGELFLWSGGKDAPVRLRRTSLLDLNPEAAIIYPSAGLRRFQILSDDGMRMFDGCECKHLPDVSRRRFRSVWISLDGR